jgi:hypothetical protein
MLAIARTFNRYQQPIKQPKPTTAPTPRPTQPRTPTLFQELYGDISSPRPGDLFNEQADWADILEPHGWIIEAVRGGTTYWRKPDSVGNEHHATTNYGGSDKLYVFSTAIPGFEANRPYSKFAAFALLNHSGCFKAAARALATESFLQDDFSNDRYS